MRGLLLAGGASRRMGQDKAMLQMDGIALWQRQVSLLRNVCTGPVAVAAPQRPGWLPEDLTWVQDCGTQGPLGGILAGLRWAQDSLLVLAVDMPRMTESCLTALLSCAEPGKGVVPRYQDQLEPLAAVYPARALATGEERARAGKFALHRWIAVLKEEKLVVPWEITDCYRECFLNVNTAQEWQSLTK